MSGTTKRDLSPALAPGAFIFGAQAERLIARNEALPLAGDHRIGFSAVIVYQRDADGRVQRSIMSPAELAQQISQGGKSMQAHIAGQLQALSRPRTSFAGLPITPGRPLVMGIVNVTPDSFSDGGDFVDTDKAIDHGRRLLEAGADILDIGGESTRPGSDPLDPAEERHRIIPVIRALAETGAVLSVDTRNASTMEAALVAGTRIINDITALRDPAALSAAVQHQAAVILMHMLGEPKSMQEAPSYNDAPLEVYEWLAERVAACRAAGIPGSDICVDPGLGFGKNVDHNAALVAEAGLLLGLDVSVLIAGSRKRFIGAIAGIDDPKARLPGSLSVALRAAREGAQMVRVHDVAETVQALKVAYAFDHGPSAA